MSTYKNAAGAKLVAANEQQAAAFVNHGFELVSDEPKKARAPRTRKAATKKGNK